MIPFDSEKVDYKFLCYYQLGRYYQSRIKFLMFTSIPYTYLWILSSIITHIQFTTIRVLVLCRVNLALAMMLYVAFYTVIVALFVLKVFRAKIQHDVAWSLQDLHYKRNLYGWFTVHNILETKEKEKRNKALKAVLILVNFMAWLSAAASSFAWQRLARRCLHGLVCLD